MNKIISVKDTATCYECGADFEWDDNESCYMGDDNWGRCRTYCHPCASTHSYTHSNPDN
jgi:hypothetical protein